MELIISFVAGATIAAIVAVLLSRAVIRNHKVQEAKLLEQALRREIREELDTEISVHSFITTVDYDYPSFHLTMHCYWCSILSGNLELKEHEAAKWLAPNELESVNWLPADLILLPFLR